MITNAEMEKLVDENRQLKKEIIKYKPDYFEKKSSLNSRKYEDDGLNYDKYYHEQSSMMSK